MVRNPNRWSALALVLLLLSGCSVQVEEDEGDDADSSNDDSEGNGSVIGNPDLDVPKRGDATEDGEDGAATGDAKDDGTSTDGDDASSDNSAGEDEASSDVDVDGAGSDEDVPEHSDMVVDGPASSTPMYLQAECGAVDSSDLPVSSARGTPTVFTVGELVGGRIDPDSVTNQEHYWQLELSKGFYHLVLDSETSDGDHTNIGIDIEQLDENGVDQGSLLYGNKIARRYRDAKFLEVEEDMTVGLRVTPVHGMEDYLLAVFENGTAVPSPRFVDCPTVTSLSLEEATSFTLGASGTAEEEYWFGLDLAIGDYVFLTEGVQADGADTNLQYEVDATDWFGQEKRIQEFVWVNEIDTSFAAQGSLNVGEAGMYFVRFRNRKNELNMTVTVSKE